ncbi:heparinase II/III family protein [Paenibacillus sepulcri]|uniref:Heparinase II/III family protein n=1 Tax=Paenibacillus sepulcri TaxID=359917 RepID=A0ABS7BV93_9BACL|nr:heparinase II/III family protein [Paenibacillus sepulcri]
MIVQIRRRLSTVLCCLIMLSLFPFQDPRISNASDETEEFIMPDTTVYHFGTDPASGPVVALVGDPNAAPRVTAAASGVQIHSTLAEPSRTFEFMVAQAGRYSMKLGGMTASDGGTADLSIDGVRQGQYSFYSVTGQYPRADLYIDQLQLAEGKHTFQITVKSKGSGMGNGEGTFMYPSRLVLTDLDAVTSSKTRSTLYNQIKLDAARNNVRQFDWAASLLNTVKMKADTYAALGYEELWSLVPTQAVPRSYNTNQLTGNFSPMSGDLKSYGNYPWKADPLNEPWKITDPASGYKFPTNDFGAYYRSGLDEHNNFDPSLADRTLLVNTLYPEKGPDWGVDDGYGWVDPATNKRYTFIAYYAHWFAWYGGPANIQGGLNALRDAYIYTGDMKYARAGAILLNRIADVYPSLDIAQFSNAIYVNSHGGTGDGKAVGSIWESGLVKSFITAYDAFFPLYDDPEIVQFLKSKGEQFDLPFKENGTGLRRSIEDNILRQVQPGVYWDQLRGNNGFHQSAVALAAVVHDTLPETKQWLDYTFQAGGFINEIPRRVTGGNVLYSLVNDVDRDGHGNEAGPGYNRLWLSTYLEAANALDGYDKYPAADLYENVKFQKMFQAMYPLLMLDKYTPSIGDSGTTGQPGILVDKSQSIRAFEKFNDPVYAQLAYMLNGGSTVGIHSDVYTPEPDKVASSIKSVIETHGPLKLGSTNLTGYGFTGLRDGAGPDTDRAAWLYYGRSGGHGHRDTLNLGLYGFGLDLAPDLGYPEQANATDVNRFEWVQNTISHNTVLVDKQKQQPQWDGTPKLYDDSSMVKLMDVEAPEPYPQTQLYKRTTAMVRIDETNSYLVDFFRVKGGSEHHFSFHAAEGPVTAVGLNLTPQAAGTYAGPDIAFGQRPPDDSVSGAGYTGAGFHWLKNVERDDNPEDSFSVDYDVTDTWKVLPQPEDLHVRLTMVGDVDDVALADGVPPQNKPGNPQSIKYLIAHRSGTNLQSTFTSVIEPYKEQRFISSISPAAVVSEEDSVIEGLKDVRAVKVELTDGRIDYIVSSLNREAVYTIDGSIRFQGTFGIYSEKDGQPLYSYVNDGAYIGKVGMQGTSFANAGISRLQGTVVDFTKDLSQQNRMTVQLDLQGLNPDSLPGTMIYVQNDGARSATYMIRGIKALSEGLYVLDIGDTTLVRSYADSTDMSQGFLYDLAAGNAFTIPLARQKRWLSEVKIIADKTQLFRNESVKLEVKGFYPDGTNVDLSGYDAKYKSSHNEVASVNGQDVLKAHNKGTAVIGTTVESGGIRIAGTLQIVVN